MGCEQVLDVGCGRGLMLIGAAKRLNTGRAIGVDIWKMEDQSQNLPTAALANAKIEFVAERVEVRTADMRGVPLACDPLKSIFRIGRDVRYSNDKSPTKQTSPPASITME